MEFKHTEARRIAFQRRMAERFEKMVNDSADPDQFMNHHVEFYYHADLNFGQLFRHRRVRPTGMERAFLEACENAGDFREPALVISRPHDNYYLLRHMGWDINVCPRIVWTIGTSGGPHHVELINLKAAIV